MSDLLALLSLGSAAIAAQSAGTAVAANNVANVNTRGYSRQRIDLQTVGANPVVGGVRAGDAERFSSELLAGRLRVSGGALAMSRAFAEALSDVEFRLSGSGTIAAELGELFARAGAASASPAESSARDAVVATARELVAGMRRRAEALEAARDEVSSRIRDHAAEVTDLARRLGDTNIAIARTSDPAMRDERDRLATALAELTGGTARVDGDGSMRFVLDGGAVLVDGRHAARLEPTVDPVTGDARLEVVDGPSRRDVTQQIGGGRLGADIGFRDGALADARDQLDQLAFDVATSMNAVHAAHAGRDGVTGRLMFVPPAGVAGAARTLALDPGLETNPDHLALAAPGAGPGDNSGARALFALAQAPVASGGRTLGNAALDLASRVAISTADAKADVHRDSLVSDHLSGLRDSLAGVDLDEELTNLARFEHASSAMTRFVTTIDDLLGTMIDRL
jgi:flagellar hook-associated protein 1 FlgK